MAKQSPSLDWSAMSVQEAIKHLNKIYGQNTVVIASAAKEREISYISTGVYALDIALRGGWPENRVIELRGHFSSFKSTIALVSMANFQRKYDEGYGVYVDVEKTFDRVYAKTLGVDLGRCILVDPDSGEQTVDVIRDLMNLSVPMFFIVDSLAAIVPMAELESPAEQQFMALQARLIGRMMRIVTAQIKRKKYDMDAASRTVLALNQIRQKPGVLYGDPETAPGGLAREFAASMMVRIFASKAKDNQIYEKVTRNGITRAIRMGQRVDFKVLKNKCGGPQGEEGDFEYYERPYNNHPANSFNNVEALFHYGAFHEVIQRTPAGYAFGKIVCKKESDFTKKLLTMPITQDRLYEAIINKLRPGAKTKVI